ncbi:MAG: hypothetical protein Q7U66_16405 [Methylobacter sp.]|nr:hypothetical protein [Methylobacter sp.]
MVIIQQLEKYDCMDAGGRATQEQLPRTRMTLMDMMNTDNSKKSYTS